MNKNTYFVGDLTFPCKQARGKDFGHYGKRIVIGGDRADIEAAPLDFCDSNEDLENPENNFVTLCNIYLSSGMDLYSMTAGEREEIAREVVEASYDSIGKETFAPQK